jgi:hypothetical protein
MLEKPTGNVVTLIVLDAVGFPGNDALRVKLVLEGTVTISDPSLRRSIETGIFEPPKASLFVIPIEQAFSQFFTFHLSVDLELGWTFIGTASNSSMSGAGNSANLIKFITEIGGTCLKQLDRSRKLAGCVGLRFIQGSKNFCNHDLVMVFKLIVSYGNKYKNNATIYISKIVNAKVAG